MFLRERLPGGRRVRVPSAAMSTVSRSGRVPSARAKPSSPSTRRARRDLRRPRLRTSAALAAGACCRFSSRSRSAVSGVRSSWEASATKVRCAPTSSSSRAAIVVELLGECADLGWPGVGRRARGRSPRGDACPRRLLERRAPGGSPNARGRIPRGDRAEDDDREAGEREPIAADAPRRSRSSG